MFFKNIKFTTPSKRRFLLARIFGKKGVTKDGGVTMTYYRWRGHLYVTKVDIEPEPYRTYRWPDHDDGRYEEYHKLVSFRKAKKGDWDEPAES